MWAYDVVRARGHPLIAATHTTTFEITREDYLTKRGTCIIGVCADKSAATLNPRLKALLTNPRAEVIIVLKSGDAYDIVRARGSSLLTLKSGISIVVRKSTFVDDRTVAVNAVKAAVDIKREIVRRLKAGGLLEVIFVAFTPDQEAEAREWLSSTLNQ